MLPQPMIASRIRSMDVAPSELDRQLLQASQGEALAVLRVLGDEGQIRQPPHERVDRDLTLDARERRAKAEVDAPAKGDVPVVHASQIQAVGLGEVRGVAVGGADE